MSVSGMAEQLIATKGLGFRELRLWMVRATNSFPVPLSPVIRTEAVLGATISISRKISCMFLDAPTSDPRIPVSRNLRRGTSNFFVVGRRVGGLSRGGRGRLGAIGFFM